MANGIKIKKDGEDFCVVQNSEIKFRSPCREEAEEIAVVLQKRASRDIIEQTIDGLFHTLVTQFGLSGYRSRAEASKRLDFCYKQQKAIEDEAAGKA